MNLAILQLILSLKLQVLQLEQQLLALQSSDISAATDTISLPSWPVHFATTTPPVSLGIGTPDISSVTTSTQESCTLSVLPINGPSKYTSNDGQFTWTSVGILDSTTGNLYWISSNGGPVRDGGILLKPYNKSLTSIPSANGEIVIPYGQGPSFTSETDVFQLNIGNATCTTSWMGVNADGSQYIPQ